MFTGQFNCVIDDKNRMAIPSVMRKRIETKGNGKDLYLTIGLEKCLFLYPVNEFDELVNKIKQLPLANKGARDFQRLFFFQHSDFAWLG